MQIPANVFGPACKKGMANFIKLFISTQIEQLNSAQLKSISIKIYVKLIMERDTPEQTAFPTLSFSNIPIGSGL